MTTTSSKKQYPLKPIKGCQNEPTVLAWDGNELS